MYESPEISLNLDKNAKELFSNVNELLKFDLVLQSSANRYIPRVSVDLIAPSDINIKKSHMGVGGVARRSKRRITYKIKPMNNGIFILTAIINENNNQLAKVPIILRVGKDSLNLEVPDIEYIKPSTPISQSGATIQPQPLINSTSQVGLYLKTPGPILCKSAYKTDFVLIANNMSNSYLAGVKIIIENPPELKVIPNSMYVGGIARSRQKNRLFSVKPLQNGIYNLIARLINKSGELAILPIEVRFGNEYLYLDAQPNKEVIVQTSESSTIRVEDDQVTLIKCPFCNNDITKDSIFCTTCGANLNEKKTKDQEIDIEKYCPECGVELPKEAKFCSGCGSDTV